MGLDQYLRIVSKVDDKYKKKFRGVLKNKDLEEIEHETNISFYEKDAIEECFDKSLKKFFIPVKVENRYIDVAKAFEDKLDKNIKDYHRSGFGYTDKGNEYYFYNEKTNEELTLILSDDECEKYSFTKIEDECAVSVDSEACYWRKAYYLQNYMRSVLGYDGNCYYMPLKRSDIEMLINDFNVLIKNPKDKTVLSKFDPEFEDNKEYILESMERTVEEFKSLIDVTDSETMALCYYEWY